MLVLGFGVAWFGYGLVVYGHALVKGYNLSFGEVFSPTSFYKGTWPPSQAPNTVIFPTGLGSAPAPTTSGTTHTTTTNLAKGKVGGLTPVITNVAGRGK
jgi:hypothetical protein